VNIIVLQHGVTLTGLKPESEFMFTVISEDLRGYPDGFVEYDVCIFTTLSDDFPLVIAESATVTGIT